MFQCYQAGRLQVARGRVGLRRGTQFTGFPSALLGQKNKNSDAAAPSERRPRAAAGQRRVPVQREQAVGEQPEPLHARQVLARGAHAVRA